MNIAESLDYELPCLSLLVEVAQLAGRGEADRYRKSARQTRAGVPLADPGQPAWAGLT